MTERSIQDLKWHVVWKQITNDEIEKVVAFWLRLGILSRSEAFKRAEQVVIMVKNEHDELVAVSTAFYTYSERLKVHVYAYRCLIQKDFRVIGLETKMTIETKNILQNTLNQFTSNKPVGMLAIVQNEKLSNEVKYAIWPGVDMIYIGNNSAGDSIRISYFDNARIS